MSARFSAVVLAALTAAGCGLTLDYGPPDELGRGPAMDAMTRDAGEPGSDGGSDAASPDASLDAATPDASAPDASALDAGREMDGGRCDACGLDVGVRPDAARDGATIDASTHARGDCTTDADCPRGTCVAITPGGYRVCRTPPVPATVCASIGFDVCCSSADCSTGSSCFLGPIHPFCGGATPVAANECAADGCASDANCPSGICAPAGTLAPVATCLDAACRRDADCTDEAGGACILLRDPCCSLPVGLVCSYPSDGCATGADCPLGYCAADTGRARCADGPPVCPL